MRARGFVAFAVGAIAFRNHFNFPSAAVTRNASEPRALANTRPQVPANRYYLQFRSERESKQYGEFCISELSSLRPEVFGPASRLRTKCIRPAIAQNHLSGLGVNQELAQVQFRLIHRARSLDGETRWRSFFRFRCEHHQLHIRYGSVCYVNDSDCFLEADFGVRSN